MSDAARVQQLAGKLEVADTTLALPHPYLDGMAEAWIATHEGDWTRHESLTLAVTTEAEGLVGAIALRLTLPHRRGELGYWIGFPYWGHGYATEAAVAVIQFAFGPLALHRVYAHHMVRNPASGRVMEKAGMQREGVLRAHFWRWGVAEDVAIWGITAPAGPSTGTTAPPSAVL